MGKQTDESVKSVLKKKREATVRAKDLQKRKVLSPERKSDGVMEC